MSDGNPIRTTGIYSGKYRELMEAANAEDTTAMEKIVTTTHLNLDYADPVNGVSLLNWCIFNKKEGPFEKLLLLGAHPDWQDAGGHFAPVVTEAARVDYTSKFLGLSLQHGANVNKLSKKKTGSEEQSPLFSAIYSKRMESVKLLVENGADVNLTQDSIWTPLAETLIHDKIGMAKYLIDHGADYNNLKFYTRSVALDQNKQPILDSQGSPIMRQDKKLTILDLLRDNQFPLNSEDHKIKMEIVVFLKGKGLDYFSYPIPEKVKRQHNDDTAFLSKY